MEIKINLSPVSLKSFLKFQSGEYFGFLDNPKSVPHTETAGKDSVSEEIGLNYSDTPE